MAWNKPSTEQQPTRKNTIKAHSAKRGVIVGAVIIVALGALCIWLFSGGETRQDVAATKEERGRIKAVTPAAAPKYVEKEEPKKVEKPIWEQPIPADLDEDSREAWKLKMAYEKKLATDERLKKYLRTHKPKKTLYKSGTEQVLDWIFTAQLGDHPPPPLPAVAKFQLNHIDEILDSVNEIAKDDTEETKARKKIVDSVKAELKQYLKEGGTLGDFLDYYRNQLVEAHERKGITAQAISDVIKEGDAELSVKFIEKANKQLEDQGITPVELSEDQKEDIAEGLMKK